MFIVHNAIRNLWRNKGRSVLIIIVATIIAAASTIGFAIVQAAQRARASALENTTIGAQISLAALTPRELATLPDDDPWWLDVVRDGRVLKGSAPEQIRRRLAKVSA